MQIALTHRVSFDIPARQKLANSSQPIAAFGAADIRECDYGHR
jgi:hypothetical protein